MGWRWVLGPQHTVKECGWKSRWRPHGVPPATAWSVALRTAGQCSGAACPCCHRPGSGTPQAQGDRLSHLSRAQSRGAQPWGREGQSDQTTR